MGVDSLCNAIANAVRRDNDQDNIKHGKISGSVINVAGRSYAYTVAVDIPVSDGDWVYVMITNNRAVVVGK